MNDESTQMSPEDFDPQTMGDYIEGQELDDKSFLDKAVSLLGKVPFAKDLMALYYASRDPEVPVTAKAVILGGLIYFFVPTDAVPDFLVGIGYLDDAAAIGLVLKSVTDVLKPKHYAEAEDFFATNSGDE